MRLSCAFPSPSAPEVFRNHSLRSWMRITLSTPPCVSPSFATKAAFRSPANRFDADLIAFTADLTNWGNGVHLNSSPTPPRCSPFRGLKVTSWAQNLTWYEKAHQEGYDEVLLLNEHGHVSECTSANVFIVRGNEILTPPLATSGCLPGVTRAILLEEIHVPDLTIREANHYPRRTRSGGWRFYHFHNSRSGPGLKRRQTAAKTIARYINRLTRCLSRLSVRIRLGTLTQERDVCLMSAVKVV